MTGNEDNRPDVPMSVVLVGMCSGCRYIYPSTQTDAELRNLVEAHLEICPELRQPQTSALQAAEDPAPSSNTAGVEPPLAISVHHHQSSSTDHCVGELAASSPAPSTRRRGRPRRIEQAAEFPRGRSPSAARNMTARRPTGRKNVMRSCERRANLEADEWTSGVEADGVRCKGCGGWYTIDARARFYPSNWYKHRSRCKGIKLKTGQPIPPRKSFTKKSTQNATSSQSLPTSGSGSSNYPPSSSSSSGAADSEISQRAPVYSAAGPSSHSTQHHKRPSPVDVMFPNGSIIFSPWSIHDDQHRLEALSQPELAQGTVRETSGGSVTTDDVRGHSDSSRSPRYILPDSRSSDDGPSWSMPYGGIGRLRPMESHLMYEGFRFQAPESCPTPRSRSPREAMPQALDHRRGPAGYPYRDEPPPPPFTHQSPPQTIRGRRATMHIHYENEYSRSGDSETSSGPQWPGIDTPSPTIPETRATYRATGYSHLGHSEIPSGHRYPRIDAPSSMIPYEDGRRLPPILTRGEYEASRVQQRPELPPAPTPRSPQRIMPLVFSHSHRHGPGPWRNISDYRTPYPASPFMPPSPPRAIGSGFVTEETRRRHGSMHPAYPEGPETSSDSATVAQSPEMSRVGGHGRAYEIGDSHNGGSDPFSSSQHRRTPTSRNRRGSPYSDRRRSGCTSTESVSALPPPNNGPDMVRGHASQAGGERHRRLQLVGPGIYGGQGDGWGRERSVLGYRPEQPARRMNLEDVDPDTDEYWGAAPFANNAQQEPESSEREREVYHFSSRYELAKRYGGGV